MLEAQIPVDWGNCSVISDIIYALIAEIPSDRKISTSSQASDKEIIDNLKSSVSDAVHESYLPSELEDVFDYLALDGEWKYSWCNKI